MPTLERALEIAARAHAGQVDKAGKPYILHVLRVVLGCTALEEQTVAALHDLLEDTPLTADDLRGAGFAEEIVAAVVVLTRTPPFEYEPYIRAVGANPLARRVKLADLRDNMDTSRLPVMTPRDQIRLARYKEARAYLSHIEAIAQVFPARAAALEGE